jgi:arylsulfatase A
MGKWKGVVLDRRKGQKIELYDLSVDEGEQQDLASEYPEVVERIRTAMNEAHVPSPYWNKDNKPLYNAAAACKVTGEKKPKKNKK